LRTEIDPNVSTATAGRIPFIWAYWAAHLGLMLSYIPLFGLFLPVQVAQVSDMPLTDQAAIVLVGSIVASLAGVMAGRICDVVFARTGSRQPMLWAGLATIGGSYALFAATGTITGLLVAVMVLQVGINLVLAGLNALFAKHVAPQDKAQLASMVNLCLPVANLGLALLSGGAAEDMSLRLFAIGGMTFALFLPLLTWRGGGAEQASDAASRPAHWLYAAAPAMPVWMAVFAARFLVQLSAALLLTFVQPYLATVLPNAAAVTQTILYMVVLAAIISLPIALGAAKLAAWRVNPLTLLQAAAGILAFAMATLTLAPSAAAITFSYAAFMAALVTYLAIDTAVIAQWLAHSPVVATRLGVMNLANTLPGILIPAFLLSVGGSAAQGLVGAFTLTAVGGGIAVLLLGFAKGRLSRANAA
jgi:hypothetical protein